MKVTVENKKGLNKDIKVFIDKKTMSAHMEKKYEEIKGTVNLKGFRPGKVPREILKRQFLGHMGQPVEDDQINVYESPIPEEKKLSDIEITKNEMINAIKMMYMDTS